MIGFVIQTNGTAIRMLTRNIIASSAAINIWNGKGINAQNNPTATAPAQEFLFICHNDGSFNTSPNTPIILLFIMVLGLGKNFLINFFGISVLVNYGDFALAFLIQSND